jgi:hypothetical protein
MTETKALLAVFASFMLLTIASLLGLIAVGANEGFLASDFILLLALQSYAISAVVMHYGKRSRDHR